MAAENTQTELLWPIVIFLTVLGLVFGSHAGIFGFLLVFFLGLVALVLLGLGIWLFMVRQQFHRDKIRAEHLEHALQEGTLRGCGKRRAWELEKNRDDILKSADVNLGLFSQWKYGLYQRWGGKKALQFLLADLKGLDWAIYYIAHEGDYRDRHREETKEAKLLEYRRKLAKRLNLSSEEQKEVDEIMKGMIPDSSEAEKPSAEEEEHGS